MTYSRACEVLGYTTPKSFNENAKMATLRLSTLSASAPLRYSVACQVLINATN